VNYLFNDPVHLVSSFPFRGLDFVPVKHYSCVSFPDVLLRLKDREWLSQSRELASPLLDLPHM